MTHMIFNSRWHLKVFYRPEICSWQGKKKRLLGHILSIFNLWTLNWHIVTHCVFSVKLVPLPLQTIERCCKLKADLRILYIKKEPLSVNPTALTYIFWLNKKVQITEKGGNRVRSDVVWLTTGLTKRRNVVFWDEILSVRFLSWWNKKASL